MPPRTTRPTTDIESQVNRRRTRLVDSVRERVLGDSDKSAYERRSMLWFQTLFGAELRDEAQKRGIQPNITSLGRQLQTKRVVSPRSVDPGQLYFFSYRPQYANDLPFFDRFPLVLVLDVTAHGFMGLNFHYLPYRDRAKLFDALYTYRTVEQNPLDTEIRADYDMLKASTKYFGYAACVRRYLFTACRSKLLLVSEAEWDLALFLPVEMFQKQTAAQVWKWSRERNLQQRRQQ